MKEYSLRSAVCLLACFAIGAVCTADQAADETAIRASAASYVEAFNKHDAKALAAHWSDQAVYQNPLTGDEFTGRAEIEKQFAAEFEELKNAKLAVEVTAISFVSPNVAVEEGLAQVATPDGEPALSEYSAVHVRQGDKWLLDRVTEKKPVTVPSHYEQLKPLEWMIGSWVDEDEEARVEITCDWAQNQNFITRSFTIDLANEPPLSGVQIIGWDAARGKVRSWAFDSDGGVVEGTWSNKDDSWIVESAAVLPDGRKASSVNIMKVIDDKTLSWQITGRDLDGEILPNLPEVKITRVASQQ